MLRREHTRGLVRGGDGAEEDVNPNSYLTNLADCMLVLSVGLMVALVAHWGVDMQAGSEVVAGEEVQESALSASGGEGGETGTYTELGRVYRDEETGKLYMVEGE